MIRQKTSIKQSMQLSDVEACLYIDEQSLQDSIAAFAYMYSKLLASKHIDKLTVVGILNGSIYAVADVTKYLAMYDIPMQIDFLQISSYKGGFESRTLKLIKDIEIDVTDEHILLIDDIYDTGRTISVAVDHLLAKGARSIDVMTILLVQNQSRQSKPDYYLFEMEESYWAIGYGMDYKSYYRNLPAIYVIDRHRS